MMKLKINVTNTLSDFLQIFLPSSGLFSWSNLNCNISKTTLSYHFTLSPQSLTRSTTTDQRIQTSSTKFPETSLFSSCKSSVALWARFCLKTIKATLSFMRCKVGRASVQHMLNKEKRGGTEQPGREKTQQQGEEGRPKWEEGKRGFHHKLEFLIPSLACLQTVSTPRGQALIPEHFYQCKVKTKGHITAICSFPGVTYAVCTPTPTHPESLFPLHPTLS